MRAFENGELRRRVDEVLFYVWDPIGVSPEPCARAEYESYVPEVLRLVEESETATPISKYLAELSVRTTLSANVEHCDEAAELLLAHKEAISRGLA
jgi:hypothetical protein